MDSPQYYKCIKKYLSPFFTLMSTVWAERENAVGFFAFQVDLFDL